MCLFLSRTLCSGPVAYCNFRTFGLDASSSKTRERALGGGRVLPTGESLGQLRQQRMRPLLSPDLTLGTNRGILCTSFVKPVRSLSDHIKP